MTIKLATVSALALASAVWGTGATAQDVSGCVPAQPQSGAQVTCAADGSGVTTQPERVDVQVAPGVLLVNADDDAATFDFGDASRLDNAGTIASTAEDEPTITAASGAALTIRNSGRILSAERKAISFEGTLDLDNAGLISAEHKAVEVEFVEDDSAGTARITNSGTIRSADHKTIDIDGDLTLENSGLISAFDKAVESDGAALVANSGQIFSQTHKAVDIEGALDLQNTGLIASGFTDGSILEGMTDLSELAAYADEGDANDGVEAGEGSRIVNAGRILSTLDRGIDAEGESEADDAGAYAAGTAVSVHNTATGEVWSYDDAVRVRGDSHVLNEGTIESHDQEGIEAGDWNNVTIENRGTIIAGDEGMQSNNGLTVENYGLINSYDDAIQAQLDVTVRNYGTLLISDHQGDPERTLDGDGVDIDGGEVWNYGSILVESDEDGVDVDEDTVTESGTLVSEVLLVNEGIIRGNTAMNTDDGNTGTQIVRSSGELLGRSGVALRLGYGDDVVEITGGTVTGDINTGFAGIDTHGDPLAGETRDAGDDRVTISGGRIDGDIVTETGDDVVTLRGGQVNGDVLMGAGNNTFNAFGGGVSGVIDLGTGGSSTFAARGLRNATLRFANTPKVIDIEDNALFDSASGIFAAADPDTFETADKALWAAGYGTTVTPLRMPHGQGNWVSGLAGGDFEDGQGGAFLIGHDFGTLGVFGGLSRVRLDANAGEVEQDMALVGLRYLGGPLTGAVWLGFGDVEMPAAGGGDDSTDTTVFGAGVRYALPTSTALSLALEAGLTHARYDGFDADGLAGASFDARDMTAGHLGAEARLATGGALTPFAGLQWNMIDGDDVEMSLGNGATRFDADQDNFGSLSLGVEFAAGAGFSSRLELRVNDQGDSNLLLGGGYRF